MLNERQQRKIVTIQKMAELRGMPTRGMPTNHKSNNEAVQSKDSILKIYEHNNINYATIKENCEFNLFKTEAVDVSIIIPVMGRESFNKPLVKHLLSAMDFFKEKTYSITFVEHSEISTHKTLCHNETNHIWIKKTENVFFNKCLAMNIGAMYSNKAKYYLFHDIDILVDKYFLKNIFSNLSRFSTTSALQAFAGRRVVVMNDTLTDLIIKNKKAIDDVKINGTDAPYSTTGAPGGSIFINSDSFYDIGGFDPELFHSYSCEDAFFYHKAEIIIGINGCDNPVIEAFHMNHPRTNGKTNPDIKLQRSVYLGFINMSMEDKKKFINNISNKLKSKLDEKSI